MNLVTRARLARLAVVSALSSAAIAAQAAVPAEVTTSMEAAKDDSFAIATMALVIVIGLAGFRYMRRAA